MQISIQKNHDLFFIPFDVIFEEITLLIIERRYIEAYLKLQMYFYLYIPQQTPYEIYRYPNTDHTILLFLALMLLVLNFHVRDILACPFIFATHLVIILMEINISIPDYIYSNIIKTYCFFHSAQNPRNKKNKINKKYRCI